MTIVLSEAQIVANGVVFLTLLFAIAITVIRYRTLKGHLADGLRTKMIGAADWDFSKSWASSFTAFFAILGTFLALKMPNSTMPLSSDQFAFLNFLFGAIVVVAPLVYNATVKIVSINEGKAVLGTVGTFLSATALTMWAVIGELWSIFFIVVSLDTNISPLSVKLVFSLILLLAWVLILWRAWFTIEDTILAQTQTPLIPGMAPAPKGVLEGAAPVPQAAPSWALL